MKMSNEDVMPMSNLPFGTQQQHCDTKTALSAVLCVHFLLAALIFDPCCELERMEIRSEMKCHEMRFHKDERRSCECAFCTSLVTVARVQAEIHK